MDYKLYAYVAVALLAVYVSIRLAGQWVVNKLIRAEFEHVLNHEEHRVKGRFQ